MGNKYLSRPCAEAMEPVTVQNQPEEDKHIPSYRFI